MKKYLFYTNEGFTYGPNGKEVENSQLLGDEKGDSLNEALNKLFTNNEWIHEAGFMKHEILYYEICCKS